jgi:hypothetical protein
MRTYEDKQSGQKERLAASFKNNRTTEGSIRGRRPSVGQDAIGAHLSRMQPDSE